jgi:hypothetical protein
MALCHRGSLRHYGYTIHYVQEAFVPTISNPGARTSEGQITFADVVTALGDSDPFKINSGEVRRRLGRGSNSTVQKHLNAIREQVAASRQAEAGHEVPEPPVDLTNFIWSAAWRAAQSHLLARLAHVTDERDALQLRVAATEADLEVLAAELDGAEARHAAAILDLEAKNKLQSEAALRMVAEAEERATTADRNCKSLEITLAALSDGAEAAQSEFNIKLQTMQASFDRMVDQVAHLKSLDMLMAARAQSPEAIANRSGA